MKIYTKQSVWIILTALASWIVLLSCNQNPGDALQEVIYEQSDEIFANPERGLYVRYNASPGDSIIDTEEVRRDREENQITVIGRAYNIPEYRDSVFSAEFLDQIREDFNAIRDAGVKTYVRFRYTNRIGGEDAPLEMVLSQIEQLAPVFKEHYDVIAFVQAGFIGAWGEWHASTNDLDQPENMRAVLFGLLDALPKERSVVVRSPRHKMNIFQTNQPTALEKAFDGSNISRTGHHNDCFLANETDVGTYVPHIYPEFDNEAPHTIEGIKDYLAQENLYMPMGGETCNPQPEAGDRFHCETALTEMDRLHWSYLHKNYSRQILDTWEEQGCMPEVLRRLGYRLALVDGAFSLNAQTGGSFKVDLNLINHGFAAPYNPRRLAIILRNMSDASIIHSIPLPDDPRLWFGGKTISLSHELEVPRDMPEGTYELLLHLPDSAPSLYDRPEYAIRLANADIWEADTGYNQLGHTIQISN